MLGSGMFKVTCDSPDSFQLPLNMLAKYFDWMYIIGGQEVNLTQFSTGGTIQLDIETNYLTQI